MTGTRSKTKKLLRGALAPFAAASLLAALLLFSGAPVARARQQQDDDDSAPQQQGTAARRGGQAARDQNELLLRLNLTPEQTAQIREIRRQSAPEALALGRRLGLARRALDEAIFADRVDDALVEARAREVAEAQAAVIRLRVQAELKVRRLLTPEQLNLFRGLRQQAREGQRRQRQQRRRGEAPSQPREAFEAPSEQRTEPPADNQRRTRPGWLSRPRRRGVFNRP